MINFTNINDDKGKISNFEDCKLNEYYVSRNDIFLCSCIDGDKALIGLDSKRIIYTFPANTVLYKIKILEIIYEKTN